MTPFTSTPSLQPRPLWLPPLVIPGWCGGVVVLLQRLLGRSNLGWTDWVDWVGVKANKWLHDMPGYLRQLAGMSAPL